LTTSQTSSQIWQKEVCHSIRKKVDDVNISLLHLHSVCASEMCASAISIKETVF
jgi:hypothetical protein